MDPNYPFVSFSNFSPHHALDQAIHDFYVTNRQQLLSQILQAEERWKLISTCLRESTENDPVLRQHLENHGTDFHYLVAIARVHARIVPEARTLDVKLSLLAELLATAAEQKVINALGVSPERPALQNRAFHSIVLRVLTQGQFRELSTLIIAKLKAWIKS